MNSPSVVLLFTSPEYGQANVNFAAAYELALAGVSIHIASFASLRDRIPRLQELIVRHASRSGGKPPGTVTFHECKDSISHGEALGKCGLTTTGATHPHGVLAALESYKKLDFLFIPWTPQEYLAAIDSCKAIIATINPDVVTIDPLCFPARDACRLLGQKFMVLSPNSIKEFAMGAQPNMASLWKYPASSSGFPFPLQWWQIPLNVYLNIRLIMRIMSAEKIKQVEILRKSFGLPSILAEPIPGVTYITPAIAETDFPYAVIPEQIFQCGPIVMPFDPLEESDPPLMKWLDNGPTVMINLGSHILSEGNVAREIAAGIRILLDQHDRTESSKIQVLWKAKANKEIDTIINEVIGKEIKEGRVKVTAWLKAEPVSILQHPNLVCTVHHGGANSFYEGILSGLPHIVLPVWYDTYDYATRVEFLNIGVFGSKNHAPGVGAEEFGHALIRATGNGAEAVKFKTAAKRLKELCRAKGNGRELAALAILKEVGVKS